MIEIVKAMEKLKKVANLYFITGIVLTLYTLISQNDQSLNIHDTYFVLLPSTFAIATVFIFLLIGLILLVVDQFIKYKFKIFQFLMFSIPFVYFIFSDIINRNNPGYYLSHPITFEWEVVYIPVTMFFIFLMSLLLLIVFIIYSVFKIFEKKKLQW
ncbi:hypothetical protein [Flavobacterium agrisoli]|nr:hypothetical protein [Flavobacterium agrisoli]